MQLPIQLITRLFTQLLILLIDQLPIQLLTLINGTVVTGTAHSMVKILVMVLKYGYSYVKYGTGGTMRRNMGEEFSDDVQMHTHLLSKMRGQ